MMAIGAISTCVRPSRARCPEGYDLRMGIRRSGDFECWPSPPRGSLYDGAGGYEERSPQLGPILTGRIYCTGGSEAIVIDERTVGCQHGGWP